MHEHFSLIEIVKERHTLLERKVFEQMKQWKDSPSRRALLVTGARQIGKTYAVREFGHRYYDQIAELNFLLNPDAATIFDKELSSEDILRRLSLVSDTPLQRGKTLVFFDEIQERPELLTAIKGLVDTSGLDFVLSGSLLGTELRDIRSNPVGYVSILRMYPLDFEEFCWGMGIDHSFFDYLNDCFDNEKPVDELVHSRFLSLFYQYLVVGGMPDAVSTFVDSNNLSAVREIQESVKEWYRIDIGKYCPDREKLKAREAFDLIPSELNNPNKRFVLKNLNEHARFRSYEDAFLWLTRAGVVLAVFNVTEPASPLVLSKQRNLFKLFYADVGLLTCSFARKTSLLLLDGNNAANFGSVYENAVAQELVAHGFDLHYFNSKKHGELDFVLENREGDIIPIEVKSGKDYKRHRAMDAVLNVKNWDLKGGLVLGQGNVERCERILYAPIYFASLLRAD